MQLNPRHIGTIYFSSVDFLAFLLKLFQYSFPFILVLPNFIPYHLSTMQSLVSISARTEQRDIYIYFLLLKNFEYLEFLKQVGTGRLWQRSTGSFFSHLE